MKKILFLAGIVLIAIFSGTYSLADVTCPDGTNWEIVSGVCIPKTTGLPDPGTDDPLAVVIRNVMNWLLLVVGVIAIIAFVISGMQYLLSAGSQDVIETAKRNMKWSIVGVIVALSGVIILNFAWVMLS
jgi:hypothetical protein